LVAVGEERDVGKLMAPGGLGVYGKARHGMER
jgi:hypothetical protein